MCGIGGVPVEILDGARRMGLCSGVAKHRRIVQRNGLISGSLWQC
jgi:hypothetical protein